MKRVGVVAVMRTAAVSLGACGLAEQLRNSASAVEALIAACSARDALSRRPGSIDLIEDCTGQVAAEATHYDAVQERYRAALEACGGAN